MSNNKTAKGNGAHKRMSNDKWKARRARSWARGQERKEQRRKEQLLRERENDKKRAEGILTPWEEAQLERGIKRHAMHASCIPAGRLHNRKRVNRARKEARAARILNATAYHA